MKRVLGILVAMAITTSLAFAAGSGETSGKQETVYLNMGSTSSTSGVYAWAVAAANAINKPGTGIQVTVIESGAGIDNLRKIKTGTFDFALAVDRLYVRTDSGVKTWSDLAGKRFSPGIPGSAAATYVERFNDILKTNINLVPMALGDAINALKENRIVGVQKSSGLYAIDAALIEVNMSTPLSAVGFTQAQVTEIQNSMPYLSFVETKRGGIKELPETGPFFEEAAIAGGVATTKISQEIGYQIVKAYFAGLEDINNAYGPSRGWDPIADYFKYAGVESLPAHAGLVQFAKERGVDVPARLIPPEYKAK